MDIDFSPLFSSSFTGAYKYATELTDEVALQLEQKEIKIKWNNISRVDGRFFYITNPGNTKENISFGIWANLWFETNSPFSISIESDSFTLSDLRDKLNEFISANNIKGVSLFEFEELINLIIAEEFLINTRYAREIVDLLLAIARECNFALDYNQSPW